VGWAGCRMPPGSHLRRGWDRPAGRIPPGSQIRSHGAPPRGPDAAGESDPVVRGTARPAGCRRGVRSGRTGHRPAHRMSPGSQIRSYGAPPGPPDVAGESDPVVRGTARPTGCRRGVRSGRSGHRPAHRMPPGSQIRSFGAPPGPPDAAGKSHPVVRGTARPTGCRRGVRSGRTGHRPAHRMPPGSHIRHGRRPPSPRHTSPPARRRGRSCTRAVGQRSSSGQSAPDRRPISASSSSPAPPWAGVRASHRGPASGRRRRSRGSRTAARSSCRPHPGAGRPRTPSRRCRG
jgi:hypothetical protein